MDRIHAMHVFIKVVDNNSFSKAAKSLQMAPSSISETITRLEQYLGVSLMKRTTRRLGLTTEGRYYYDRCREILQALANVELSLRALNSAFSHNPVS